MFELALAGDGQGLVFDADVDVLQIDIGEVGFEDQFVLGFEDIDGGGPGPIGLRLGEEAGESVFEDAQAGQADRNG